VQRSFRQEPGADTLLRLLHDYIRECDAVVCVIGARSGACPPPDAAGEFAHLLPPGITEASYTQWEFFFARAHQRRLSLYIAAAGYRPDRDAPSGDDFPELQKAFVKYIEKEGLHYAPFSNRDALRAEVLKEPWPEERRAKPILLPYPSLGSLFKGREGFLRRLRESLTPDKGNTTAIVSKALYGMGGIARRGRRSNMPGPIVKTTPLYSSPKPILRKNCVATLRASPGRCGWPKPKKPRRRCG